MERARRKKTSLRNQTREARRVKRHFRRRIIRSILVVFGGLGGLAIILSLVLPNSLTPNSSNTATNQAGIQVATQGAQIIGVGDEHPVYNTAPPTSGWYYDIPLDGVSWGVRQEAVEDEVQVLYLEHGVVMVQYNCPEECPDLMSDLERVVNSYPSGVVMAPYPDMDTTIALTAWGWIDTFESFDQVRIDEFIQGHLDKASGSLP